MLITMSMILSSDDRKDLALRLIKRYDKLISFKVQFESSNREKKAKKLKKLRKAIFEWGKKYHFYIRDVWIVYTDCIIFTRHPSFKFTEMSISETEDMFYDRMRRYVEANRSPAQLYFLHERDLYLEEKYFNQ